MRFGDIMGPHSHFTGHSVFYRPTYQGLICKIVNLSDVDVKFLGQFPTLERKKEKSIYPYKFNTYNAN